MVIASGSEHRQQRQQIGEYNVIVILSGSEVRQHRQQIGDIRDNITSS
eukprot:gene597-11928_t